MNTDNTNPIAQFKNTLGITKQIQNILCDRKTLFSRQITTGVNLTKAI